MYPMWLSNPSSSFPQISRRLPFLSIQPLCYQSAVSIRTVETEEPDGPLRFLRTNFLIFLCLYLDTHRWALMRAAVDTAAASAEVSVDSHSLGDDECIRLTTHTYLYWWIVLFSICYTVFFVLRRMPFFILISNVRRQEVSTKWLTLVLFDSPSRVMQKKFS